MSRNYRMQEFCYSVEKNQQYIVTVVECKENEIPGQFLQRKRTLLHVVNMDDEGSFLRNSVCTGNKCIFSLEIHE